MREPPPYRAWRGPRSSRSSPVARLALLALLVAAPLPAAAQDDEATGRALLEQALEARDAGQLAVAERLLRSSVEAFHWSYSAFVWAQVLLDLDRRADALEVYEDLDEGAYGTPTDAAREAVRTALEETRQTVPRLTLRLTPSPTEDDAQVVVDDADARPLALEEGEVTLRLNAGRRRLRIDVPGYRPATFEVSAVNGARLTREVTLESVVTGRLVIDAPDGAVVRVDGEVHAAPVDLDLPAGAHQVVFVSGGEEQTRDVRLRPGAEVRLDFGGGSRVGLALGLSLGAAVILGVTLGLVFGLRDDGVDTMGLPVDPIGT